MINNAAKSALELMLEGNTEELDRRIRAVGELETKIKVLLGEDTNDPLQRGTTITALLGVLADVVVKNVIQEPPKTPAPMLSMLTLSHHITAAQSALTEFVANAVREAEMNGVTLVLRHGPRRPPDAPPAAPEPPPPPETAYPTGGTDEISFEASASGHQEG